MTDAPPQVFGGRYRLDRHLARGGMANVYLAHDLSLDRPVAVKVLFPEFATDLSFVERFRREAQAAANLNHPHIVSVFDWGEQAGTYFIVMEYIEGQSLAELLRANGPFPAARVAELGAEIAAALDFAHQRGVVHRDVKPGNVLVAPGGEAKVADFGIARAVSTQENLTQAGSVMGTATYFSPEQARGEMVDARSDVYALGVVLYELLVGTPPFTGDNPVAVAYKQVQEQPVPPRRLDPSIPPALEAVTLKALAKRPADRYPSAGELRNDLLRFHRGQAVSAVAALPATGATRAVRAVDGTTVVPAYAGYDTVAEEIRPRRWPLVTTLLVLVLALVGLGVAFANNLGIGDGVAKVDVPDVVGETVDDATTELEAAGFEVKVTNVENDSVELGRVVRQDPEGGSKFDEGGEVELFVSAPKEVAVPDLVGDTLDNATRNLTNLGLLVESTDQFDDVRPRGEVLSQDPVPGTPLAAGGTVKVVVSKGPTEVAVPDVRNKSRDEAADELSAAGFNPIIQSARSDSVEVGKVIRTDPGTGSMLAKGSNITVYVASGAATIEVPNVLNQTEAQATAALQAAGFRTSVAGQAVQASDVGKVVNQSPSGGERAAPDAVITIVVGQASTTGSTGSTTTTTTTTTTTG